MKGWIDDDLVHKKVTSSDCNANGSSSTSGPSPESDSVLKFELSSSFRFGFGGVDMKSGNEVVDVVGGNSGIVEGDTNDTLNIKEDVGDGCPSVLRSKDIILDSNSGWIFAEINNDEPNDVVIDGRDGGTHLWTVWMMILFAEDNG